MNFNPANINNFWSLMAAFLVTFGTLLYKWLTGIENNKIDLRVAGLCIVILAIIVLWFLYKIITNSKEQVGNERIQQKNYNDVIPLVRILIELESMKQTFIDSKNLVEIQKVESLIVLTRSQLDNHTINYNLSDIFKTIKN